MDKDKLINYVKMLKLVDAHLKMASLYRKSSTCQKTISVNRFSLVSTHDNFYRTVILETEECIYM